MSDRQIRILPTFTGTRADAICFETQASPEEVNDLSLYAFEHHGDAFSPFHPGSVRLFHERLMLGQDMPATMILTRWYRYDQLLAAAMFVQPSIVLEPTCTSLVNSLDLVDRFGPPAFAHIPYDHKELAYMLRNLTEPYATSQAPSDKNFEVLQQAIQLIVAFVLENSLPPIAVPTPEYEILDREGPFVAFSCGDYVWDELYRQGFLCGVWFRQDETLIGRKSSLTPYLRPEAVLRCLEKEDPEGDWEHKHGAVVGKAGISQQDLLRVLKELV